MIISSGQKLQSLNDYTIKIYKDGVQLNETTHSKFIGLTDDNLSWKAHQHDISKKASSNIGALKQVEPFVSMHTEVMIYKGLIEPRFDYCKAVWGGLCYRGAYLWNNLPQDVRTHSKFSKSDDFEGKFTLGLLIMLPQGNHVKQFIELIHLLLLYEYFNRLQIIITIIILFFTHQRTMDTFSKA